MSNSKPWTPEDYTPGLAALATDRTRATVVALAIEREKVAQLRSMLESASCSTNCIERWWSGNLCEWCKRREALLVAIKAVESPTETVDCFSAVKR